jgi:hypothetical protein
MVKLPASRGRSLLAALVFWHRWASVGSCLLFALWFASGAVMLFVQYPALAQSERLARAEPLVLAQVLLSPAQIAAAHPAATQLRLLRRDTRNVYVAQNETATVAVVDAATGAALPAIDAAAAGRIAARFERHPVAGVQAIERDQWVVSQGFDATRPLYRVALDDAAHTDLYVSASSGEVVQRTTRTQRAWNWAGAVLHWIYFTPLRQHWSVWDALVWLVSLLALSTATVGFGLGIYRYIQARRQLGAGFALYRRWMRWHHLLGVCAGVVLLAWIFSGWLSMDHGRLFSRGDMDASQQQRFQGLTLPQVGAQLDELPWRALLNRSFSQLQFRAVAGQAFVLARGTAPTAVLLAGETTLRDAVPESLLLRAAHAAWQVNVLPETATPLNEFYARAEEAAPAVAVYRLAGTQSRLLLLDRQLAEPVVVMNASRRQYAWWYYGLHTNRWPGMQAHDGLRKGLMLIALAAGLALSITGVVLAWRRLR